MTYVYLAKQDAQTAFLVYASLVLLASSKQLQAIVSPHVPMGNSLAKTSSELIRAAIVLAAVISAKPKIPATNAQQDFSGLKAQEVK